MNTFISDRETEAKTIKQLIAESGYANAVNHVPRMYRDRLLRRTMNTDGVWAYFTNLEEVAPRHC